MPQIFRPRTNTIVRLGLVGFVTALLVAFWAIEKGNYDPWGTQVDIVREQPIPFSHKHHVGGLGIDCRYCHQSVENSSFAGMPAAGTCMNCHRQMWIDAPMLEPVRESYKTGKPILWNRVHNLPEFVFFNHSIHIHKGIGCVTCHGRVDKMPMMMKANSLLMMWCLNCHRNPTKNVRPISEITSMTWTPPADQDENTFRAELARRYHVESKTDCTTCHR